MDETKKKILEHSGMPDKLKKEYTEQQDAYERLGIEERKDMLDPSDMTNMGVKKVDLTVGLQFETEEKAIEAFSEYKVANAVEGFNIVIDGNKLYVRLVSKECDDPFGDIDKMMEIVDSVEERARR